VQECPQPPLGRRRMPGEPGRAPPPTAVEVWPSVAPFGEPTRSVCRSSPLPSCVFSWLHFRQPRRQQPHVAAHSSDHRIGSGLRPRDRRPFVGARHPLRPHFARSSSAGHRRSAARDTSWLTLITSSGRHIMRRSVRQAPSAASRRPPRRTAVSCAFSLPSALTQSDVLGSMYPDATLDQ
jgi:hypothetical protein